jgi:hypothetical protein
VIRRSGSMRISVHVTRAHDALGWDRLLRTGMRWACRGGGVALA